MLEGDDLTLREADPLPKFKKGHKTSTSSVETCHSEEELDFAFFKNISGDKVHSQNFSSNLSQNEDTKIKLKSELCKKFNETGCCIYGDRCRFAHGCHELRQNQQFNHRYKTKECGSFFKLGFCKYGDRCNFLHCHIETNQEKAQKQRVIICNYPQLLSNTRNESRLLKTLELEIL